MRSRVSSLLLAVAAVVAAALPVPARADDPALDALLVSVCDAPATLTLTGEIVLPTNPPTFETITVVVESSASLTMISGDVISIGQWWTARCMYEQLLAKELAEYLAAKKAYDLHYKEADVVSVVVGSMQAAEDTP